MPLELTKMYVASRTSNWPVASKIITHLQRELGIVITYDWTTDIHKPEAQRFIGLSGIGKKEIDAVVAAEIVIVVQPVATGSSCELGAALATNKPVLMYAESLEDLFDNNNRIAPFFAHQNITLFVGRFIDFINSLAGLLNVIKNRNDLIVV